MPSKINLKKIALPIAGTKQGSYLCLTNYGKRQKTTVMQKVQTAKEKAIEFNQKAIELNCRARLGGTPKSPKFYRFTGMYTNDGWEYWLPIGAGEFSRMIAGHKTLCG